MVRACVCVTFFLHFCSNSNNAGLGNCSCACSGFSELAGAKLKGKPSTVAVDFGKLYSILGRTAIGTYIVLAIALLPSESSCWWTEFFRFFVDVFKDTNSATPPAVAQPRRSSSTKKVAFVCPPSGLSTYPAECDLSSPAVKKIAAAVAKVRLRLASPFRAVAVRTAHLESELYVL